MKLTAAAAVVALFAAGAFDAPGLTNDRETRRRVRRVLARDPSASVTMTILGGRSPEALAIATVPPGEVISVGPFRWVEVGRDEHGRATLTIAASDWLRWADANRERRAVGGAR